MFVFAGPAAAAAGAAGAAIIIADVIARVTTAISAAR